MTTTHTPGAWGINAICLEHMGQLQITTSLEAGEHIATVTVAKKKGPTAEQIANAALIAGAPELLAALQSIIEEAGPQFGNDDGPGTINRMARSARLAIANATGGKA